MTRWMLPNIGLALFSLVVSLGAAELFLRARLGDRYYVWPPNLEETFHPAHEAAPGIAGPSRVTINPLGIRGDDFSARNRYRLLAVGGSTTLSIYLDDSEA